MLVCHCSCMHHLPASRCASTEVVFTEPQEVETGGTGSRRSDLVGVRLGCVIGQEFSDGICDRHVGFAVGRRGYLVIFSPGRVLAPEEEKMQDSSLVCYRISS